MIIYMLIRCYLWHLFFSYKLFIQQMLFKNIVQNLTKVMRKHLWWKSRRFQLQQKKTSSKVPSRESFQNSFFLEQLLVGIRFVHLTNKHPLAVAIAVLWNSFPKKCAWWSPVSIKSQVKVTEARFRHFSRTFSTSSE